MDAAWYHKQPQRVPSDVMSTTTSRIGLVVPPGFIMTKEPDPEGDGLKRLHVLTEQSTGERWVVRKNAQTSRTYFKNERTGAKQWTLAPSAGSTTMSPASTPGPSLARAGSTSLARSETMGMDSAGSPNSPFLQQRTSGNAFTVSHASSPRGGARLGPAGRASPPTVSVPPSGTVMSSLQRRVMTGAESILAMHLSPDPESNLAQLLTVDPNSALENDSYEAIGILERIRAHRRDLDRSSTIIHTPRGTRDFTAPPQFSYYDESEEIVEVVGDDPDRRQRFNQLVNGTNTLRRRSNSTASSTTARNLGNEMSEDVCTADQMMRSADLTSNSKNAPPPAAPAGKKAPPKMARRASFYDANSTSSGPTYRQLAFSATNRGKKPPPPKKSRNYDFVVEGLNGDTPTADVDDGGTDNRDTSSTDGGRRNSQADDRQSVGPYSMVSSSRGMPSEARYLRSRLSEAMSSLKQLKEKNEELGAANTDLRKQLTRTKASQSRVLSANPSKETCTDDLLGSGGGDVRHLSGSGRGRTTAVQTDISAGGTAATTGAANYDSMLENSSGGGNKGRLAVTSAQSPNVTPTYNWMHRNTPFGRPQGSVVNGAALSGYGGPWGTENLHWSSAPGGVPGRGTGGFGMLR